MKGAPVSPHDAISPGADGLANWQVEQRVAAGQVNRSRRRSSRSLGAILRANLFTRFNAILGTLAVVMLVLSPRDALFGLPLVFNAAIGILQEWRAKRMLDRLSLLGEARPTVRRDGVGHEVSPDDIVLDDVIELQPGEAIFTDGEIIDAEDLEINEALLSGESAPVMKALGEPVLSGSFVVAGTGLYRTTKVGADTYAAKLTAAATRFDLAQSELQRGINQLLRFIQWLMIPIAILLAISQLFAQDALRDSVIGAVAGVVPMVPEGLVLLTSVAFAIGAIRLARRNCLVQELPAVEILSRVDVACVDKTGTLTEDRMAVRDVIVLDDTLATLEALASLAAADPNPNASMQAIVDHDRLPDAGWSVVDRFPFSSSRKWSGASFAGNGTWLLGAPDVLLPHDSEGLAHARELSRQGLRVLAVAKADGLDGSGIETANVKAAGLVVLEQRIRPDAAETLRFFRDQGVSVKVISGDDAFTVGAVAQRLDLAGADQPVDMRSLPDDPEALAEAVDRSSVFGRVSPSQKAQMVQALQARGHVVAMTGDGVNDVLALKGADIGVAMGAGSDAAKSVARVVLLDNKFATLPHVLAEGRRVLANIERVAHLFLSKTVYATVLALAIGVVGLPYPFLPRHLTLVGSLTIGIPAFFLALAPNAERARPGFVPRVLALAIPAGVLAAIAALLAFLVADWRGVASLEEQRTTATITLFVVACFVLVLVARPLDAIKLGLIAIMIAAFVVALAVPPIAEFFALPMGNAIDIGVGVAIGAVASLLIWAVVDGPLIVSFRQFLHRRLGDGGDSASS